MTFIREEALLDYHNKDAINICILLRELVDNLMNREAEDGENDARFDFFFVQTSKQLFA